MGWLTGPNMVECMCSKTQKPNFRCFDWDCTEFTGELMEK